MGLPHEHLSRIDQNASDAMSAIAIPMLRITLGITYLWFGVLKILGVSPVSSLVGKMSFGLPSGVFIKLMGVWESAIGIALLLRMALRPTLILFFMQLAGTFIVFLAHPREAFRRGNPLLLTERGEFIVKNLVLLSAGVAVGSRVGHSREEIPPPEGQMREVSVSRGE